MAHKFIITTKLGELTKDVDESKPVLYKIMFGNTGNYYVHKGKLLVFSLDRLLEEVTRGTVGKSCSEYYKRIVEYCKSYPGVNKISVELIYNGQPSAVLSKEKALLDKMKKDPYSLNNFELEQLRPEWMLKDIFQKRCDECIPSGVVDGKKTKFRFCPNCGHLIK